MSIEDLKSNEKYNHQEEQTDQYEEEEHHHHHHHHHESDYGGEHHHHHHHHHHENDLDSTYFRKNSPRRKRDRTKKFVLAITIIIAIALVAYALWLSRVM